MVTLATGNLKKSSGFEELARSANELSNETGKAE